MIQVAHRNEAVLHEWQALLEQLAAEIEGWSKSRNWAIARHKAVLEESELGSYEAPSLHIHTGKGALIVEPVARHIVGADGRVNFYNLGSFKRLVLIRRDNAWKLFTEDRVPWPGEWNEQTFVQSAEALTTP